MFVECKKEGCQLKRLHRECSFSFSIGSNFFMEIAKLRAGRLLWSKIIDAFGGNEEAQKMTNQDRTSSWTKTVYDPYVNMLRGTTSELSCHYCRSSGRHVSPFDEAVRPADEFSRRIARNTQIISEKEAHLSKVADPGWRIFVIQSLTDSLVDKHGNYSSLLKVMAGCSRHLRAVLSKSKSKMSQTSDS